MPQRCICLEDVSVLMCEHGIKDKAGEAHVLQFIHVVNIDVHNAYV